MNQFIFGSIRYANGDLQHIDATMIAQSIMACMAGHHESPVADIKIFFKSDKGNTIKVNFQQDKMQVLINDDEQ